jgi:hypothetical protein
MNDSPEDIPSVEELAGDPEIAALLDFEPAPVKPKVNGWDPDAQRAFVALLPVTGSKARAARAIGRKDGSLKRIFDREGGAAFKAAVDAALDLFRKRHSAWLGDVVASSAPERGGGPAQLVEGSGAGPFPGQALNEHGEWEDEASLHERIEEARDSIAAKLLKCRRLYLQEISSSPGKRAAFEILSDFDVDWEKAAALEPQGDEPYASPNMRDPQFLLTAEAGWMGHMARGRDKIAELRAAIDEHRAEEGLPPVEWGADSADD